MHQTIVGVESSKQVEIAGDDPDILDVCSGGGSDFAGLVFAILGKQPGVEKRKFLQYNQYHDLALQKINMLMILRCW